jgi:transposase
MDSKELYSVLLGIGSPWTVGAVTMDLARQEVVVRVEHGSGARFVCPQCQRELGVFDHLAERRWRHLDSCQFKTFVATRPPRVNCPEHGKHVVVLPWSEAGSRFTALFEALAVEVLLAANVKRAAELLRITWAEAWQLMQRAVCRGRAAKGQSLPTHLGADEKAIAKGHRYRTVVSDLQAGTVEYVGEERTTASLAAYYAAFSAERRTGIEAVSMDMWAPYVAATEEAVPGAAEKIVFDCFHIMQHVLAAVDKVRRQENKALRADGDERLVGSKYLWLRRAAALTGTARTRLRSLRDTGLKTARAWQMKETLRDWWDYRSRGWAERFWKRWYFWATHSRLAPMIEAAKTIQRHLPNVLTYFAHRVTNAVAEAINAKIAAVSRRACGFRNPDHFKIAIYFHCGGLNLLPTRATPTKVG